MNNQIRLESVFLLESRFFREPVIDFSDTQEKENQLSINVSDSTVDGKLIVNLEVLFISPKLDGTNEIEIYTKYCGIFSDIEQSPVEINTFGKINAPAILFPFIRENFANLSLKGQIPPIILPPVNFVELFRNSQSTPNDLPPQ